MAVATDLTWNQLNKGFQDLLGLQGDVDVISIDSVSGRPTNINFDLIVQNSMNVENDLGGGPATNGVIKFATKFYDACVIAQERVNADKPVEEDLTSFRPVTSGPIVGTKIPITRTFVANHDVGTSTSIVGTNN